MYAERASGFASWIRRLGERFSGDAEKLPAPSHPDESLKGVVEYTLEYMMERGIIHRCGYCGKFYCDENPESRFCDDACSFQHGLNGTIANTMKHFKGHLIGGG
jgi:hypothetical protein